MCWKLFPNRADTEQLIISLFVRNYVDISSQSYYREQSAWGSIAAALHKNELKLRKWLYNLWKEDRNGIKTRSDVLFKAGSRELCEVYAVNEPDNGPDSQLEVEKVTTSDIQVFSLCNSIINL